MNHSETLEQTKLWEIYSEKLAKDPARVGWTKKICEAACEHLKAVRDTFPNFTLHDGAHVLNVLDAMAGLLGSQIDRLRVSEAELLLLAAALHDIGMVYTPEDEVDSNRLRDYTEKLRPKLRGKAWAEWEERDKTDFLRWQHPFRVDAVLEQPEWRKYFDERDEQHFEGVPERVIIAVCRAHGETPEWVREQATKENGDLCYLSASEVDPLFCAILLRLADILDFDDSRAPLILFPYAKKDDKSVEEWKKHQGSWGFTFPSDGPNTNDLPYKACFTDANIERAARRFLDWIDVELYQSRSLLRACDTRWKDFPFPFQVNRKEINSKGYDYGDFQVTMDQDKILELLTGENLYSDRSVFVRELLQNSIDATLLRAQMDPSFGAKLNTDAARIDLWEWTDDKGDLWFRIDDNGTGMTRGMLEKYFLKAGNSYYNSEELKRDLDGQSFTGISRFGIGFLSCFLCGQEAQVSTLYCDSKKSLLEAERDPGRRIDREKFGLRLDVTGLNGFFTLRNQALRDNRPAPFPAPPPAGSRPAPEAEEGGYRSAPGTSIAIRLDPGLLGAEDLRMVAEHWVCYPRMPVYYNGQRLGMTHDELIAIAREERGVREYELSEEDKRKFNEFVPELAGQYPTIRERIEFLEAGQIPGLPNVTVILSSTELDFRRDTFQRAGETLELYFDDGFPYTTPMLIIISRYGRSETKIQISPSMDTRKLRYCFGILSGNIYGYKGIVSNNDLDDPCMGLIESLVLDEDANSPLLYVDRSSVKALHMKTAVFLWLLKKKWHFFDDKLMNPGLVRKTSLAAWKSVISEELCSWAAPEIASARRSIMELSFKNKSDRIRSVSAYKYQYASTRRNSFYDFFIADLQIRYRMTVDYAEGQKIEYVETESAAVDERLDCFPPMPFCYGKTAADRTLLCAAVTKYRIAVTADHPFTEWLLTHAEKLRAHYPRQLEQITEALCEEHSEKIISTVGQILDQLAKSASRYDIDISACPRLTEKDFWVAPEIEKTDGEDSDD